MARSPLSPVTLGVLVREGCLLRAGELLLLSDALLDGANDAMRWSQPLTIRTQPRVKASFKAVNFHTEAGTAVSWK